MLNFNTEWRFDSPEPISPKVREGFSALIKRCVVADNAKDVYEHFKQFFAVAAGTTASSSSSTGWAETDLDSYMSEASENAPLFIEAFFEGCQALPQSFPRPSLARINRVLEESNSGWLIKPPLLIRLGDDFEPRSEPIPVQELPENLDANAKELIHSSLSKAEKLLAEKSNRLAVQEIVWLLETVSTVFQGLETDEGSIQGKYFNKIVGDLRRIGRGTTLEQVLGWVSTLHGYLSSPSGGGIRHGAVLTAATSEIGPNEARLYCNLIRSYILYLLAEHRRLTRCLGSQSN
jgi:hypothetical protein